MYFILYYISDVTVYYRLYLLSVIYIYIYDIISDGAAKTHRARQHGEREGERQSMLGKS